MALYAERLAAESGWYEGDPMGLLGQLNAALFRARRLVVDTGLHAKRWSWQQAVDYLETESKAFTEAEVDRRSRFARTIVFLEPRPCTARYARRGSNGWIKARRSSATSRPGDSWKERRLALRYDPVNDRAHALPLRGAPGTRRRRYGRGLQGPRHPA